MISNSMSNDQAKNGSQLDVLVVEDSAINQRLLSKQLTKLGVTFGLADNGQMGIELWQRFSPKIIITDCQMPILDGMDMARAIREFEASNPAIVARTPIVAASGSTSEEDINTYISAGMDGALAKPVKLAALKAVLDKWLPRDVV